MSLSGPAASGSLHRLAVFSTTLEYALRAQAVHAHEDKDPSAISERHLVSEAIELAVKGHLLETLRTLRCLVALNPVRLATDLVCFAGGGVPLESDDTP